MDKRSHWLWVSLPLLLVQGVSSYLTVSEDSLCDAGSKQPALLRLESSGAESSALVEIGPRRHALGCPLLVMAPSGYLLAIRLVPRGQAAPARAGAKRHGECSLQVMTSHSLRPAWELDLCNESSLSRVLLMGVQLYRNAAALTWTVSDKAADSLQAAGILITVVTKGSKSCSKPGMVPCVNQGGYTLLCVPPELACDGHVNCPVGSFDEDDGLCRLRDVTSHADDSSGSVESDTELRESGDSLAKALAHYGPWGYLMLGTLLCGALLMVCGLWECCCRGKKVTRRPAPLVSPQAPAVYIIGGPEAAVVPAATAPPTYEELDQPPDYRALFPADKEPPNKKPSCAC